MAGRNLLADAPAPPKGRDLLSADNGTTPVPVAEDQPGWDWLRNNAPGVFNWGHNMGAGIAEGVGNLPNVIPNTVNRVNEIIELHGGPKSKKMDQWMTGTGWNDKSLEEMNPITPGYEGVRDYGRMTGTALPAGPAAAIAVPALAKLGSGIGSVVDYFTGDPSIRDQPIQDYLMGDAPPGKWSQTGEFLTPLAAGGVVKGGKAIAPTVAKAAAPVGRAAVKAAGPVAGLATLLKTGEPTTAYVAAKAAPASLQYAGKIASAVAPPLKPLVDAIGGKGLADLLARAYAPAVDSSQRGPR